MAKDYFQDIMPPNPSNASTRPPMPSSSSFETREASPQSGSLSAQTDREPPEKSVRNISISGSRRARIDADGIREGGSPPPQPPRGGRGSRYILWGGAALALLVLGAIALVALRPTTVTIIPRSHAVLFDETARFTAYPEASAATGTLPFTVETSSFEDSQVVPAQGIERAEDRASGTITVYNEYSSEPVKLLKNTRFEAPQGLIFKTPAEVVIPGKRGTTPGEVSVTVIADKAGESYNIGPVQKFTLPGLRSAPDMYAKVYARSTSAMSGGFVGDRPAASPAALEAARAEIRNRLEENIRAFGREKSNESAFAFSDLARVVFETPPATAESDGKVRLYERATVELPVFSAANFAYTIGQSVSADAENGAVSLRPGGDFSARWEEAPTTPLATSPLAFTLRGKAQLVWKVNTEELAAALAGRDEIAFQTIVESFPGIEEARARIEPFWKSSFPTDPSAIKIKVQEPKTQI